MFFEDFTVGQKFQTPKVHISKSKILTFAQEYDPMPFHLSESAAKKTSFKKLIAPGVMSFMSVWAEFVKMNVWEDTMIAGLSTNIRWLSPVFVSDTLQGEITVSALERKNKYRGIVTFSTDIFNQDGLHVIHDITEALTKTKYN